MNSPGELQGDVEHTEAAPHLIQKRSWRIKCGDWNEPQTTDTEASQTNALLYVVRQAGKNISTYSHTTLSLPGSSTLESLVFICEKSHFCIIQFFLVHVSHLQLFFFFKVVLFYLSNYMQWNPASERRQPCLVWLTRLSAGLWVERSLVWFPVRTHAWIAGQVPSWGCVRGNQLVSLSLMDVYLPLFLLPFPSLWKQINKIFIKKKERSQNNLPYPPPPKIMFENNKDTLIHIALISELGIMSWV